MFVTHSVTEGGRAIFAHNRHNRPPLGRGTPLPLTKPDINRKEECESLLPPSPFSSSSTIDISQSVLWPLSPLARPLPSSLYPLPGEDKGHRTTPLPFPPFPLLPCDPLFATQRLRRGGYIFKIIRALASPHVLGREEIEAGTKAGPFLALRTPPDRERGGKETNISTACGFGHFILDPRRRWRSWKRTFSRCSIRLFPRMELGKKVKLDRWLRWWFGSTAAVLGS